MYPLSFATLHLPFACVLERALSSLSPPDHLLYQMLKVVPVCGGGSDDRKDGSTCGRAGRFLRRIIFLTFFWGASATSVEVLAGMSAPLSVFCSASGGSSSAAVSTWGSSDIV